MALKVLRYKNYGCMIKGPCGHDKFYFSFYELNNGRIVNLILNQNNDIIQYDFSYTKLKLKNGKIKDYKFGKAKAIYDNDMSKEFFDWFDSCPPAKDVINNVIPNKNEEKCVKNFFKKNIKPTKLIKTDTTEVKP